MFPHEFGLQSVFVARTERGDAATRGLQAFAIREKEIAAKLGPSKEQGIDTRIPVPKRLRGDALALITKMQLRYRNCAFLPLLDHYCPDGPARGNAIDIGQDKPTDSTPLVGLATPLPQVSAFCRAIIQKVIPDALWGTGDVGAHNKALVFRKVDMFIRLQRFENLNLHAVLQGLKVAQVEWLQPPKLKYSKMSQTDARKRLAVFAEFLYFVFDGFLIPLIAANFYVTESSTHRNRLFYFRHDVWRRIAEPAMAALVSTRLEPLEAKEAVRLIGARGLGFGKLRLLPKKAAMRPIVNLRRAIPKQAGSQLAPSINTVLRPIAAMLNLEMKEHPERLGSGMLSTHGIYARLKGFKEQMRAKNQSTFYFAKVDVQSAFDTIPQKAMVRLLGTVPEHPSYSINHHVEIAPTGAGLSRKTTTTTGTGAESLVLPRKGTAAAPRQVWRTVAKAGDDPTGFHDAVEGSIAQNKRDTVFVDGSYVRTHFAEPLAKLAATHIQDNVVRVGDKYYRQKEGIPQGSVLSSTLCSYFYADLEEKELGFLRAPAGAENEDCLLLRLIDDFLVITTNRAKAARFVEVMQRGHPAYGVAVNPSKSLVNFALEVDGKPVPRLAAGQPFPYCGTMIHCASLNLAKDRDTKAHDAVFSTITVEHLRSQGYHFKRKISNYFQIQSHRMFFDTSFNSRRTALRNLHAAFAETANKMWAYARCMPKAKRPSTQLTISTIQEVGVLAHAVLDGKRHKQQQSTYEFSVPKAHLK
ncbi:Telomerase reverse transcriptase [Sporothrix curviconia]|uniref:Telomerase reverse transcriptase n=1 Tax=Sporothrix curviconia TaxID=1260050 RepID=A0ABP0BI96_9PEZI